MTGAEQLHCQWCQRAANQQVGENKEKIGSKSHFYLFFFFAGDLSNVLGLGSQASGLQDLGHVVRES